MADNVIGIKFGVAGEGSISGESGKLIKSQLEQIAKAVNLQVKVNINKTHFRSQLADLKKEIDATFGDLKINVGATGNKGGSSNGGGAKTSSKTSDNSEYASLKKDLNEIYKLKTQIEKLDFSKTNEKNELTRDQAAQKNANISEEQRELLNQHEESLRRQLSIQERLSQAKRADKAATSQQKSWDGLIANAERLLQREDYLIQNNKKAAASAAELQKAMDAGFDPSDPEQAAQAVERLRAALRKTDGDLAKIGKEADTFGFKIKKAFQTKVVQNLAYALLALVGRAFRQVYKNVIELDKAITDLQIATGMTRKETGKLVEQYAVLARELGATVTQVTSAADTWLRQGYSVAETNQLITNTLMLSKLGQIESADAARALTSAMKG